MSNDRDTHFQGFAKLLIDRLLDNTEGYFLLMRDVEKKHDMEEAVRVISQSAYDFVVHIRENINETHLEWMDTPELISEIPDLAAWPNTSEQSDTSAAH